MTAKYFAPNETMKAHLLIAGLVALIPTAAMAHSQLVLPLPWWISALGDGQSQCRLGYVGGTYFLKCEQVPAPTQARE